MVEAACEPGVDVCIAPREQGPYVVDLVRGRRGPFDPVEVTKEYAQLCKEC